jgi:hypothetical protein
VSRYLGRGLCAEQRSALAPAKTLFALAAGSNDINLTTDADASGGPFVTGTAEPMIEEEHLH